MKEYTKIQANQADLMTRDQVRDFDAWAIKQCDIPSAVLMENAGRSCAEIIHDLLEGQTDKKISVICGKGNNGGDGFAVARHLANYGFEPQLWLTGQISDLKGDAQVNARIWEKMGLPICVLKPGDSQDISCMQHQLNEVDLVVDGLFGTGLIGEVRQDYAMIIEVLNQSQKPILSIDIPSGLDCDTGEPLGVCVQARYTVTFAAVKKGFANPNAQSWIGGLYLASIGIESRFKSDSN